MSCEARVRVGSALGGLKYMVNMAVTSNRSHCSHLNDYKASTIIVSALEVDSPLVVRDVETLDSSLGSASEREKETSGMHDKQR